MKITIETIEQKIRHAAEERAKLSAELDALRKAEAEAKEKVNAAADAGDVELYTTLDNERQKLTVAAFVKSRQLEKLNKPFTEEEILDAWKDYAGKYGKDLDRKLKDFASARKALVKSYMDICKMQGEMLHKRRRCVELSSFDAVNFPVNMIPLLSAHDSSFADPAYARRYAAAPDLFAAICAENVSPKVADDLFQVVINRQPV